MNRLWVARVAIMAIVLSPQMMMKGSPKKKVKAESGRASADNPTLQIEPIDATRTLPEYFVGSPVELIYSMFVGGPPRNEFETSAEYDKRRSELQRPGLYPFLISGVSATYDADKAMFVVELAPKQVHPTDGKNQVSAFECESVLPEEQAAWITKHSFLAKDSFSARYNVVIDQPLGSNRVMVPLGRERAREAKPYLRAVVLVHLDAEAAQHVLIRTPDDIVAGQTVYTYVHSAEVIAQSGNYELALTGRLHELRVYDFRTGEIYAAATSKDLQASDAQPLSVDDRNAKLVPARKQLKLAEYPVVARKARIAGTVTVEVTIAADGSVKHIGVLKPLPFGMDATTTDAIKASRFEPALKNGKAVESTFQVQYIFAAGAEYGVPVD